MVCSPRDYEAGTILALAAVVVALGLACWFVREPEASAPEPARSRTPHL